MAEVRTPAKGNSSSVSQRRPSVGSSIRNRRSSVNSERSIAPSFHETIGVPRWKAWALLIVFSMAQAIDLFNVAAPTIALPQISADINISYAARQWVVSAYSLTFGAFMLTGGRISAIIGHKTVFISGFAGVAICTLVNGFSINGPMLFVFRAFQGIGASLTIPSALAMITYLFPNPGEQDLAIGIFAGIGALGGIIGLILGGIISQFLNWRWIFWVITIVVIPMCILCFFLAPSPPQREEKPSFKQLDYIGLITITLAFILFIYALTEGNTKGWKAAGVLVPLIISILLFPMFGFVETKVASPLVPPVVWSFPGFIQLFLIALSEYMTMNIIVFEQSAIFQSVWGTSAVSASLRIFPFGITLFLVTIVIGYVTPHVSPRWILVVGQTLICFGSLLLTYAPTIDHYWTRTVPGMILAALGCSSGFVASNIAILRTPLGKPSIQLEEANALIGAIFNADLQLGSALGLAIATAIITQINAGHSAVDGSTASDFRGYRGAFYFIMGLTAFEALLALFTLRNSASTPALMLPESERKVLDVEGFTVEQTGVDSEKSPRNASIPQSKRLTRPEPEELADEEITRRDQNGRPLRWTSSDQTLREGDYLSPTSAVAQGPQPVNADSNRFTRPPRRTPVTVPVDLTRSVELNHPESSNGSQE